MSGKQHVPGDATSDAPTKPREGARESLIDNEPCTADRYPESQAAEYLFCLRCGTAMAGEVQCPECGFPKHRRGAIE
jgi:hypothetical protein